MIFIPIALAAVAIILALRALHLARKAGEAAKRAEAHASDALHSRKVYRFQIPREGR